MIVAISVAWTDSAAIANASVEIITLLCILSILFGKTYMISYKYSLFLKYGGNFDTLSNSMGCKNVPVGVPVGSVTHNEARDGHQLSGVWGVLCSNLTIMHKTPIFLIRRQLMPKRKKRKKTSVLL